MPHGAPIYPPPQYSMALLDTLGCAVILQKAHIMHCLQHWLTLLDKPVSAASGTEEAREEEHQLQEKKN